MITADLNDEPEFFNVSPNTVARLMREMNLKSRTVRKFVAPNLLNRELDVKQPNRVWVSDITYLRIGRKWDYLTVFMDLFSRAIVGWDLSDSLERYSAIRALNKAAMRRKPSKGLMVHSDLGISNMPATILERISENMVLSKA